MPDRLLAFYQGDGFDSAGRLIPEVWSFDRDDLEWHHDFIQWLFPLPQASRYNPDAPVLTPETAAAFRASDDLRARVLWSLDMMLAFYGFERVDGTIVPAADFEARADDWAWPEDHNHLRLSRMIQSLDHLGLPAEARALRAALLEAARALGPQRVSRGTVGHWRGLLRAAPEAP